MSAKNVRALVTIGMLDGHYFLRIYQQLPNGNFGGTHDYIELDTSLSDSAIVERCRAALQSSGLRGSGEIDLPEKAFVEELSRNFDVRITLKDLARAERVAVTQLDGSRVEIVADRLNRRGQAAEQWSTEVDEGDDSAMIAAIKHAIEFAHTVAE